MNRLFYIYVFPTIAFEILAQYLFKKSYTQMDKSNNNIIIGLGLLFYSLSGYFAYKILKYGSLGVVNVVWHVIHFIALFIIGYYIFNERLTRKQVLAITLGLTSLGLLESGSSHSHSHLH